MAKQKRRLITGSLRAELWTRWKNGQAIVEIARALGFTTTAIRHILLENGGITPAKRRRSRLALSLGEREEISRGIAAGESIRRIASRISRAPSTVSREITRNGGRNKYRCTKAESAAWDRARRPKQCRLAINGELQKQVAQKLSFDWSPTQISGWLKVEYQGEESMQISHETIYKSLFIQAKGVLKKELISHLRRKRKMRQPKAGEGKSLQRGPISDPVSISERPAGVEDRAIPGHWEGDLMQGSNST